MISDPIVFKSGGFGSGSITSTISASVKAVSGTYSSSIFVFWGEIQSPAGSRDSLGIILNGSFLMVHHLILRTA
ncbi:hypothetical protein PIB30_045534 [Stylosanthes scabra]|uniref:Dirigent protein n=1 Tax=Stylosanthes scabra TaxID=79078 RepID=A0ABU6TFV4_9FABA|nr:hypothetical protein [Stylosanthes scabra]